MLPHNAGRYGAWRAEDSASRDTVDAVRTGWWSLCGVLLIGAMGCTFEPDRSGVGEICRRDRDCQEGLACLAHECIRRGGGGDPNVDAGRPRDAGPRPPDTGPRDAGPVPMDAGPRDAGPMMDTGPVDAGPTDAGIRDALALPDVRIGSDP